MGSGCQICVAYLLGSSVEVPNIRNLQRALESAHEKVSSKQPSRDFPGGAVVKNPPANAGDTGSSPGPGRSPMPWSN